MNKDIENRAWLAGILEDRISKGKESRYDERAATQNGGLNYFVFEELFRGSRDDTKGKQSKFVKYFEGCRNVLDIGCGRGEFLELLVEHGISGRGIDIDEDMVRFCKSRDLKAEKLDAIDYLSQLEDKSLDGIFIDQVVEHLDPDYLIRMISLCYTKMLFGGYIVIETVNPLSLVSFANFYMDMSHKRPIHPETLKFLIRAAGFREAVAQFYEPVGEDRRLRPIDVKALGEEERRAADLINRNTEVLNNIIFGPQDYAVIGKK
jgi:O-antigen chain-terminating methyltransferase